MDKVTHARIMACLLAQVPAADQAGVLETAATLRDEFAYSPKVALDAAVQRYLRAHS